MRPFICIIIPSFLALGFIFYCLCVYVVDYGAEWTLHLLKLLPPNLCRSCLTQTTAIVCFLMHMMEQLFLVKKSHLIAVLVIHLWKLMWTLERWEIPRSAELVFKYFFFVSVLEVPESDIEQLIPSEVVSNILAVSNMYSLNWSLKCSIFFFSLYIL